MKANVDYLANKDVDWVAVESTLYEILNGNIPAAQLPTTQQVEQDALTNAPRIVLDEQFHRGKRSDYNYLLIMPGQSQELGQWFTRKELKDAFPDTHKEMIKMWKETKGLHQRSAGGITTTSDVDIDMQAAVEAEAMEVPPQHPTAAAAGRGQGGEAAGEIHGVEDHLYEHQTSVIEGRISHGHGFDQRQQEHELQTFQDDYPGMEDNQYYSQGEAEPSQERAHYQREQQQQYGQDTFAQRDQDQQQFQGSPTGLQLRNAAEAGGAVNRGAGYGQSTRDQELSLAQRPPSNAFPSGAGVHGDTMVGVPRGQPAHAMPAISNIPMAAPQLPHNPPPWEFDPEAMQLRPLPMTTNGLTPGLGPFLQFLPKDIPPGQIPSVAPPPPSLSQHPSSRPQSGSTRRPAASAGEGPRLIELLGSGGGGGSPSRPQQQQQRARNAPASAGIAEVGNTTGLSALLMGPSRVKKEPVGCHPLLQMNLNYAQAWAPPQQTSRPQQQLRPQLTQRNREYHMNRNAHAPGVGPPPLALVPAVHAASRGGEHGATAAAASPVVVIQQHGRFPASEVGNIPHGRQNRDASVLSSGRKRRQVRVGPSRDPRHKITGGTPEVNNADGIGGWDPTNSPKDGTKNRKEEKEEGGPVSTCKRLKLSASPRAKSPGVERGGGTTLLSPVKSEPEYEYKPKEGAVGMIPVDVDEVLTLEEREKRMQIEAYLRPDKWAIAKITGAKNQGQGVDLWITWRDGFKSTVPSKWLQGPDKWHCMASLIDFYESKTKKKGGDGEKGKGTGKKENEKKEREDAGLANSEEEDEGDWGRRVGLRKRKAR